ncbi:hypothetical protein EYF80_042826 [Liparis tanakae]|uniref:Uncharacterized protein n=1 Tax=Liparis tanakae TaxID=230148 RepID=A0A4Z2G0D9_9TELE|nr:hypothetical protein EYF80_042826 [Liparis tanakae]
MKGGAGTASREQTSVWDGLQRRYRTDASRNRCLQKQTSETQDKARAATSTHPSAEFAEVAAGLTDASVNGTEAATSACCSGARSDTAAAERGRKRIPEMREEEREKPSQCLERRISIVQSAGLQLPPNFSSKGEAAIVDVNASSTPQESNLFTSKQPTDAQPSDIFQQGGVPWNNNGPLDLAVSDASCLVGRPPVMLRAAMCDLYRGEKLCEESLGDQAQSVKELGTTGTQKD